MPIIREARANSAKPLRLLLRVPLAFLPFGYKRSQTATNLESLYF
nr:MAG TPA: hypothetical protein [Caudoviricetes sp.]